MIFTLINGNTGKKIIDSQIVEETETDYIFHLGSDPFLFKDVKRIEIFDENNALLLKLENPTFEIQEEKNELKGGNEKI